MDQVEQFGRVVFREILASEDDLGAVAAELAGETVAERLDGGFCTEVGTADADDHHQVDLPFDPAVHDAQAVVQLLPANGGRQTLPAEEIVAGATLFLQHLLGCQRLFQINIVLFFLDKGITSCKIYFYHILDFFPIVQI